MTHTAYHILLLSVCGLLAAACTEEAATPGNGATGTEEAAGAPIGIALTRAEGDNVPRTYRALLFDPMGRYINVCGTYFDDGSQSPTALLTPWQTNDKGEKIGTERSLAAGLYCSDYWWYYNANNQRVSTSTFRLLLVTPAVNVTQIDDGDGQSHYAFPYFRCPKGDDAVQDGLSFSNHITYTATGRGETYDGVYRDIIDFDQHGGNKLRQPRSKLRFVVQCGDNIDVAKVSKLTLSNVADHAYWNPSPQVRDFEQITFSTLTLYDGPSVTLPTAKPKQQVYMPSAAYADVADDTGCYIYMLAQNLSEQKDGAYTHTLPTATITIFDNITYEFNLGYDLEPHKYYTYTLTINSVYLDVTLTVGPWDDTTGTISAGFDETETITVPIGSFTPLGWDDGGTMSDLQGASDSDFTSLGATLTPGTWEGGTPGSASTEEAVEAPRADTDAAITPDAWDGGGTQSGNIDE